VFDPAQSVSVDRDSPGGLAAGSVEDFTVATPPGGNCFDPNCEICVTVDHANTVAESNETNNELCQEFPG
jgi:subtilase family serine protease